MEELSTYNIYFFLSLAAAAVFLLRRLLPSSGTGHRLPPSPTSIPILGHLHLLSPIPHQALYKLSLRHGPLMHLRLGSVPCVVASDAATAKLFLKTYEANFADRPSSGAIHLLSYGSADFSFAPHGPYWQFMKRLCMSELLGGRMLDQLLHIRQDEVRRLVYNLQQRSGEAVDMGGELLKVANNVISRMTIGRTWTGDSAGEVEEVRRLVEDVAELTGKFNLSDYICFFKNMDVQGFEKRCKKVLERFDAMMNKIIAEKYGKMKKNLTINGNQDTNQSNLVENDILDRLFEIASDEQTEIKITEDNIKAFIMDIFVAGTDTSAITLEWTLSELINHPEILRKAAGEINSNVGNHRLVEESDLPNLPYIQAIVKETLRLHPTGPIIPRESTHDCLINGYNIAAGTRLFVNVWAIGRDPANWEDPLEFVSGKDDYGRV